MAANHLPLLSRIFILSSCLILLFVLVYTGLSKWINFDHFSRSMHSQPIPDWLATGLTYLLPPVEIITALMLCTNRYRIMGLWITTLLMFLFTAYVFMIRFTALENTTCPCGGLFSQLTWNQHTWINSALFILSLTTTFTYHKIIPGHGKRRNADASDQTK